MLLISDRKPLSLFSLSLSPSLSLDLNSLFSRLLRSNQEHRCQHTWKCLSFKHESRIAESAFGNIKQMLLEAPSLLRSNSIEEIAKSPSLSSLEFFQTFENFVWLSRLPHTFRAKIWTRSRDISLSRDRDRRHPLETAKSTLITTSPKTKKKRKRRRNETFFSFGKKEVESLQQVEIALKFSRSEIYCGILI